MNIRLPGDVWEHIDEPLVSPSSVRDLDDIWDRFGTEMSAYGAYELNEITKTASASNAMMEQPSPPDEGKKQDETVW